MANELINALLTNPGLIIKDEKTGLRRWPDLNIISAVIGVSAESTDLPQAANGATNLSLTLDALSRDMAAGKIIHPSTIVVKAIVESPTTVASIITVWQDVQHSLSINSRSIVSTGMAIVSMEIDQTPEATSAIYLNINFQQAIPENNKAGFDPKNEGDESSYGIHVQSEPGILQTVGSLYNKVSAAASSIFS